MIHPGNVAAPKKCWSGYTAERAEKGCRFPKTGNLRLPQSYCPYAFVFNCKEQNLHCNPTVIVKRPESA